MKKIISIFLVVCLLTGMVSAFAIDKGVTRAVIGADLTAEQKTAVYKTFGVEAGSVPELSVTNAEERTYLNGFV